MIFSPLEQFEIVSILPIRLGSIDISFTNSSLFMLMSFLTIVSLFSFSTYSSTVVPNRWQSFVELIYQFILGLVEENLSDKGYKYFPFMFVLFMFIVTCNLLGMIPYSFTVTSHIIVTLGLSSAVFFGATIIGFKHHGIHFFSFFLPPGSPLWLAPLLVTIEIVSYCSRLASLAIRLFANMMSGHSLLKILAGFSWSMLSLGGIFYVLQLVPLAIVFAITGLELGIAILQAYVFTVLSCIYINEAINLH